MKKDIHPNLKKAKIRCACGNEIETENTVGDLKVEICAACHPFFTGKQKLVDTAGRVDKFKARMEKAQEMKDKKEKPKKKLKKELEKETVDIKEKKKTTKKATKKKEK